MLHASGNIGRLVAGILVLSSTWPSVLAQSGAGAYSGPRVRPPASGTPRQLRIDTCQAHRSAAGHRLGLIWAV